MLTKLFILNALHRLKGVCVTAGCVLGVCVQGGCVPVPKQKSQRVSLLLANAGMCAFLCLEIGESFRPSCLLFTNIYIYMCVCFMVLAQHESRFDLIFELSAVPR